jgi:hypothetical protein
MKKTFLTLLLFTFFNFPAVSAESAPDFHDDYQTEAEIPEPLFFDLVRRLGSEKGELEFNSLTRIEGTTKATELLHAPEIEYAFMDGGAVELELPMEGSTLKAIKGAFQFTFGRFGNRSQWIHGFQTFYETGLEDLHEQIVTTYILGHRLSHRISYLLMLGPAISLGPNVATRTSGVINMTIFYNSSREVDFGLEVNWMGPQAEFKRLQVMPQLHLLFQKDWKVQAGFGIIDTGKPLELTSAFRIIKEFN